MRIVDHQPDTSQRFGLIRAVRDGSMFIKTGRTVQIGVDRRFMRKGEHRDQADQQLFQGAMQRLPNSAVNLQRQGYRIDILRPSITVQAALRLDENRKTVGHYQIFRDRDNPDVELEMNVIGVRQTLALVLQRAIPVVNGWMDSYWTFKVSGGQVILCPDLDWIHQMGLINVEDEDKLPQFGR